MTLSDFAVVTEGLTKVYVAGGVKVEALRDVDLRVRKGEFVAIVGPSGSGKSTLLNVVGTLDRPTSGKVYVDGVDVSRLSPSELAYFRNKKVGFVFQAYNLINRTTCIANVELPAVVAGISRDARRLKALELLKAVGIYDKAYRKPTELSQGEQQRVAIARALINDPAILLADEPTGNLDSKTGLSIIGLLRKMNEEMKATILMVTHNVEFAKLTNRIVRLKDGRIEGEEVLSR